MNDAQDKRGKRPKAKADAEADAADAVQSEMQTQPDKTEDAQQ